MHAVGGMEILLLLQGSYAVSLTTSDFSVAYITPSSYRISKSGMEDFLSEFLAMASSLGRAGS